MVPFIQWVGGKVQIKDCLLSKIPGSYNCYYEPFVGGGAIGLALRAEKAVFNDINLQLMNAYTQVKLAVDDLIALIAAYTANRPTCDLFMKYRKRFNEKVQLGENDVECAALMIWLDAHCFGGLYRKNKNGLYNAPFNSKSIYTCIDENNIREVSAYLSKPGVVLLNVDFEKACEDVAEGDFVFFDSPSFQEKSCKFTVEDHGRLSCLFYKLNKRGAKLMLTDSCVSYMLDLYQGFNIEFFQGNTGKDILVTNY